MILLIDNYDSFTYNLYQYLMEYIDVRVVKNDCITIEEINSLKPEGIVISPGPKAPKDIPQVKEIIKEFSSKIPILGVCLGHQAIVEVFGGRVIQAKEIVHGKTSLIKLKNRPLFNGIRKKLNVTRYHSLIADRESLPEDLEIIGETIEDNIIMAIKHKEYDVYGVQFHPESILTEKGKFIIMNFVEEICHGDRGNY
ncbi:anthranilate synthase component 2 [Clostridium cavendishii DSM 21758]|uniref:Anthranilate synthase component 2 n=1 Tax=Clostridium cavendishii DSM 21758 TaxID=1121302 RepID=A0A1M6I5K8_9CLOT|nr:aminodeoxychorismate/anthranilate synthase component II [Clostridium cavendishii]SHJ29728.1 anthranilate synthase component 2 [Clostridium cavendishii DSM 21758]